MLLVPIGAGARAGTGTGTNIGRLRGVVPLIIVGHLGVIQGRNSLLGRVVILPLRVLLGGPYGVGLRGLDLVYCVSADTTHRLPLGDQCEVVAAVETNETNDAIRLGERSESACVHVALVDRVEEDLDLGLGVHVRVFTKNVREIVGGMFEIGV